MGTFVGHLVPGLALSVLGLWHTINTIRAYMVRGSANFAVRYWYPFNSSWSILKHLELIFMLSFSIFAIFMQVIDFPFFHFSFKLDNFEHATMFIHLALFSGFTLCTELMMHSFDILSGIIGILVASVFSQELFLLHFHSADHAGLEGHYHWLLQLIVSVSLVATLVATSCPNNFPAALVLSISVIFQGCWFINMGFMLWFPAFIPDGCITQVAKGNGTDVLGAVACLSNKAGFRARALANLQFSWILSAILALVGCISLQLARRCTPRNRLTVYQQLRNRGVDSVIAPDGLKQTNP